MARIMCRRKMSRQRKLCVGDDVWISTIDARAYDETSMIMSSRC